MLQYILFGFFFAAIATAGIVFSCLMNRNPLFTIRHLLLFVVGLVGLIEAVRHLFGIVCLRRQYRNLMKTEQSDTAQGEQT